MIFLRKYQLSITVTCSLWAESAHAAELGNKLQETAGLVGAIAKVFGALAVVVALMMLLVFVIKKLGLSNGLTKTGSRIKIIETRMVAPKKYIAIAQIAGKNVALGITDHNINLLTDLDEQEIDIDEVLDNSATPAFTGALRKAVSYIKNTPATPRRESKK